jgi:hypothetical protein
MVCSQSPMIRAKRPLQDEPTAILARRFAARFVFAVSLVWLLSSAVHAIPVNEYHQHIRQAVTALDTLAQSDENESVAAYDARDTETVQRVRNLIPRTETVELQGTRFIVDNAWLHQEFDKYAAETSAARYELLQSITERLEAIDDRIEELEKAASETSVDKAEDSRKLAEILSRPEFAQQAEPQSAANRLLERLLKWIQNLFPKPKPISPGSAGFISRIAQWFVIILALAVLAFVLKLFLPRMFSGGRPKRKRKEKARIVLGERLEPDQSARDLLSEAEALARRGELRTAIRKAYIALLVDLGDRKIISLAQYKTNRDYLRAMREVEPLYRNVKQLTDSFELHWYGLAPAKESDWQAFRAAYDQALAR